jgi:DNA-binding winged helix-turn-helix (wHTH) protein/tetratricopeptide (TPR) repeat protein
MFCRMGGADPAAARGVFRFGVFDLDTRSGELRKRGVRVKLPGQSIQVLTALLERPGEVVTRDELRERLWPAGTHVDFEHSLANAINRIRDTLGDSPESPRFIETVPRSGYRFLMPVGNGDTSVAAKSVLAPETPPREMPRRSQARLIVLASAALMIGGFLALPFPGRVPARLPRPARKVDPEANSLYQRARYGPGLTADSIAYFEKAIAKDPRFAQAHAGLSSTYITLALQAQQSPREIMPRAGQEARRALEIDDGAAEAHLDLGTFRAAFEWDRAGAEREYRRALELDPNLDGARAAYALFLAHMGRFDEAMDQIAAFEKGPVGLQSVYASVLYMSRQYQRAAEYSQWALGFAPAAEGLQFWLGRAYADQSRWPDAIELIERSRAANRLKGTGFGVLPGLYARTGRRPDALRLVDEFLQLARTRYISPASIAIAYIGLGDFDNAFQWLDKACVEHDFSLSSLKVEPVYDPVRTEPRFQALLRKVNLE